MSEEMLFSVFPRNPRSPRYRVTMGGAACFAGEMLALPGALPESQMSNTKQTCGMIYSFNQYQFRMGFAWKAWSKDSLMS
jgi:hypothetical protein